MTTIKVFEIEKSIRGFCEYVENVLEENQFLSTFEKAQEKLKDSYNDFYEEDIEEGLEVPALDENEFTIKG